MEIVVTIKNIPREFHIYYGDKLKYNIEHLMVVVWTINNTSWNITSILCKHAKI